MCFLLFVCTNKEWTTITADIFDMNAAQVFCKELSDMIVDTYTILPTNESHKYTKSFQPNEHIGLAVLNCTGDESKLSECQYELHSMCVCGWGGRTSCVLSFEHTFIFHCVL